LGETQFARVLAGYFFRSGLVSFSEEVVTVRYLSALFAVSFLTMLVGGIAEAGELDDLVNALVKKGVIQKEDLGDGALSVADLTRILKEKGVLAEADLESGKTEAPVQPQYVTKEEVEAIVREDAGGGFGLPKWIDGLTVKGDIRVRYENIDRDNESDTSRARLRARLGIEKKFDNGVTAGLRTTSGHGRTSTNETMDNNFGNMDWTLDRAYVKVNPEIAEWLKVTGGRMANPFLHTNLLWDSDLNFDGAAENAKLAVSEELGLFLTLGQFSLEPSSEDEDALLWGFQGGAGYDITDVVSTQLGVAYYNFQDVDDSALDAGNNTGAFLYEYRILDIVNKFNFEVMDLPVTLWWNIATNVADEPDGAADMDEDFAWGIGGKVGKCKEQGTWEAGLMYKEIEADAVISSFTDSDFGGSNREGFVISGGYQLLDHLMLKASIYASEEIETAAGAEEDDFVTLHLDAIAKF